MHAAPHPAAGEGLAADLTLLVAPGHGAFRPLAGSGPTGVGSRRSGQAARVLPSGEVLGHVTGPDGRREVCSPADAVVSGVLAAPGQLVGAGQVLAWGRRCPLDALGLR